MRKVSEIISEYNISQEVLFDVIKKETGEEINSSTKQIGNNVFENIKSILESKDFDKTDTSHSVFTESDILGMDFLGSTFKSEEKEGEEDKLEDNIEVEKERDIEIETIKFYEKKTENAKVIKAAPKKKKNPPKTRKSFAQKRKERLENKPFANVSKDKITNKPFNKSTRKSFKKKLDTKKKTIEKKKILPKKKVEKKIQVSDTLKKKDKIIVGANITIKELSEKMGVHVMEVMKVFIMNKIMVNINSSIDYDTIVLMADEFGVEVEKEATSTDIDDILEGDLQKILDERKIEKEKLVERPPVVTIMGHVDHGKTKLLDYIRQTNIVGGEAGGITQTIGASQAVYNNKKITFIDTPGHELFTSMRARGAKITDIAIIVIAADDGIKQQTKEAIDHARAAEVPIIVAITKMDLPNANPEMVKSQMSEYGLLPEEWGGDIPVIPLSSINGEGIEDLMEIILLQAEMLELSYNPECGAVGIILEASKNSQRGVLSTLLILTGTLKMKDIILAYNTYGKIKSMKNWLGEDLKEATGGDPVQILGISNLPESGRIFEVVKTEKDASQKVSIIKDKEKQIKKASTIESFIEKMENEEKVDFKVILKAADYGSLEALKYAVGKAELPEGIEINILHSEVGQVKESDIILASASKSFIIGFDASIPGAIKKKADEMKVSLRNFSIIYEILDYISGIASGLIVKEAVEVVIGKLEILEMFWKKGNKMILGGIIKEGKARNGAQFRLFRGDEELGGGAVTSLQKEQENVNELGEGHECGLKIKTSQRPKEGDILEFYIYE